MRISDCSSECALPISAIVRLASATGRNPHTIRRDSDWSDADLVVATPERAAVPVGGPTQTRLYKTTLMILPKWRTVKDERHSGWVRIKGLLPTNEPDGVLAPTDNYSMRRRCTAGRQDEHTSELQTLMRYTYAVSCFE